MAVAMPPREWMQCDGGLAAALRRATAAVRTMLHPRVHLVSGERAAESLTAVAVATAKRCRGGGGEIAVVDAMASVLAMLSGGRDVEHPQALFRAASDAIVRAIAATRASHGGGVVIVTSLADVLRHAHLAAYGSTDALRRRRQAAEHGDGGAIEDPLSPIDAVVEALLQRVSEAVGAEEATAGIARLEAGASLAPSAEEAVFDLLDVSTVLRLSGRREREPAPAAGGDGGSAAAAVAGGSVSVCFLWPDAEPPLHPHLLRRFVSRVSVQPPALRWKVAWLVALSLDAAGRWPAELLPRLRRELAQGALARASWSDLAVARMAVLDVLADDASGDGDSVDEERLAAAAMKAVLRGVGEWRLVGGGVGAELPTIPDVGWADIGGLEHVKEEVTRAITLPLRYPHLFAGGGAGAVARPGLLLFGPPGNGKTLLAKAIAHECGCNFLSVKGPELLDKYVGESERNIRRVFEAARAAAPCIVFMDEIDALAPRRGAGVDTGGVMDRVVAQLLAEMDAVDEPARAPASGAAPDLAADTAYLSVTAPDVAALCGGDPSWASDASVGTDAHGAIASTFVAVIAATNRPDLLDPALLRPGRLETLVFLPLPTSTAAKRKVLAALTRRLPLAPDVDLRAVAAACDLLLSGADLYGACAAAYVAALRRAGGASESGALAEVRVSMDDMLSAAAACEPSVTAEQAAHYEALCAAFGAVRAGLEGDS